MRGARARTRHPRKINCVVPRGARCGPKIGALRRALNSSNKERLGTTMWKILWKGELEKNSFCVWERYIHKRFHVYFYFCLLIKVFLRFFRFIIHMMCIGIAMGGIIGNILYIITLASYIEIYIFLFHQFHYTEPISLSLLKFKVICKYETF